MTLVANVDTLPESRIQLDLDLARVDSWTPRLAQRRKGHAPGRPRAGRGLPPVRRHVAPPVDRLPARLVVTPCSVGNGRFATRAAAASSQTCTTRGHIAGA